MVRVCAKLWLLHMLFDIDRKHISKHCTQYDPSCNQNKAIKCCTVKRIATEYLKGRSNGGVSYHILSTYTRIKYLK